MIYLKSLIKKFNKYIKNKKIRKYKKKIEAKSQC